MEDPTYEDMVHYLRVERRSPVGTMQFINEAIYWFAIKHGKPGTKLHEAIERCGFDPGSMPFPIMSSETPAALAFEWLEERYAVVSNTQIDQLLGGVMAPEDKDLYDLPEDKGS